MTNPWRIFLVFKCFPPPNSANDVPFIRSACLHGNLDVERVTLVRDESGATLRPSNHFTQADIPLGKALAGNDPVPTLVRSCTPESTLRLKVFYISFNGTGCDAYRLSQFCDRNALIRCHEAEYFLRRFLRRFPDLVFCLYVGRPWEFKGKHGVKPNVDFGTIFLFQRRSDALNAGSHFFDVVASQQQTRNERIAADASLSEFLGREPFGQTSGIVYLHSVVCSGAKGSRLLNMFFSTNCFYEIGFIPQPGFHLRR